MIWKLRRGLGVLPKPRLYILSKKLTRTQFTTKIENSIIHLLIKYYMLRAGIPARHPVFHGMMKSGFSGRKAMEHKYANMQIFC